MAAATKFQNFVEDLGNGVHNFTTHTLKIYFSNTTPSASGDAVKADLAEIATGNGYSGPVDVQNTWAETGGTATLTGTKVTVTASGGNVAQFRYIPLFNDDPTSPADPLICSWDYGSAIDLAAGESFSVKFNNSDTTGTILTLA